MDGKLPLSSFGLSSLALSAYLLSGVALLPLGTSLGQALGSGALAAALLSFPLLTGGNHPARLPAWGILSFLSLLVCLFVWPAAAGFLPAPQLPPATLSLLSGCFIFGLHLSLLQHGHPERPGETGRPEVDALHEAGHALVMLGQPGRLLSLSLDDTDAAAAHVHHRLDSRRATAEETRLLRLFYLAGFAAERWTYPQAHQGSASDLGVYQALCRDYRAQTGQDFFFAPSAPQETEYNLTIIRSMQQEDETLLRTYFELNREVLEEIQRRLTHQRQLEGESLEPLRPALHFPPQWPKVP